MRGVRGEEFLTCKVKFTKPASACPVTFQKGWLALSAILPLSLGLMDTAKVTIRRAQPGDEGALALVGAATFLESYAGVVDGQGIIRHCEERHTAQAYGAALDDPEQALWLACVEPGAAPVGYLHLAPPSLPVDTGPGDIEIKRIYVLARMHGTGLGRQLMETAIEYARMSGKQNLLLGVYKGNAKALAFYGRAGFEALGERSFDVGGSVYCDWVMGRAV